MIFLGNLQALLIAVCGGVVAALYKLSYERKQSGSSYDWVDFMRLSVTASFPGVIGFLLASWKFGDPFIILASTGIASTGGYQMLVGIKDSVFKVLKDRLTKPVMGARARKIRSTGTSSHSTRIDCVHERDKQNLPKGACDSTSKDHDPFIKNDDSTRVHCAEPRTVYHHSTMSHDYAKDMRTSSLFGLARTARYANFIAFA